MKILPTFTVICSTFSLLACGGGGSDNSATTFTITDENVVKVMEEAIDFSIMDRATSVIFEDSFAEADTSLITVKSPRNQVINNSTIACASGNAESTYSYDDEDFTKPAIYSYTFQQCQPEGATEAQAVNGSYSYSREGESSITLIVAMDLSDSTMTLKGNIKTVMDQSDAFESSLTIESTTEKYGHYSLHSTSSGNETTESGSGVATFANNTVSWVYVDNGIDITLQSTGTTQFISAEELDL